MKRSTPSPDSPPAGIAPAAASASPRRAAPPAPAPAPEPEAEFGYAPPAYDPANYRWVPVRRVPRSDGWTEEKQRRFIEVLADTGLVSVAAKEVGMTRMSAYRLRRAPYAASFARAWDVARECAGTLIEDITFERAIEGVEEDRYTASGELADSKRVYNDRLLTFLLSHLKPERYSREARSARAHWHFAAPDQPCDAGGGTPRPEPASSSSSPPDAPVPALESAVAPPEPAGPATLDAALRAMEPALPAPAEELLGPEALEDALLCAEIADGTLPHFHGEQRAARSPEQLRADAIAAQLERGRLADEKFARGEPLGEQETVDWYAWIDPPQAGMRRRKPRGE